MKHSLLIIILTILSLVACRQGKTPTSASGTKAAPSVRIKTTPVVRMDMLDTIRIYGEVKLRQEALLASQFDGRLADFSLLMGDHVIKGEKLGIIIPPMREALLQTMDQMDQSQKELLSEEIREIPLYSPISGVVLQVFQHTGDVIQKGETIVHIGELTILDIRGDLPLRYLKLVRGLKSLNVAFINYPHKSLQLRIQAIGGKVDQEKQTVPVRLQLDNHAGEFRPGMQVKLYFPGSLHKKALVIPRSALLEEEGIYSAFVLREDQTVEKRNIILGIVHDNYIEVLSGLKEGEWVATQKAYSLTDGMEVIAE